MPWAVRISSGGRLGTAAVLSPNLLLTCWHVTRDAATAAVLTPAYVELTCRVVAADPDLDVALLEPDGEVGSSLLADLELIPRRLWRGAPVIGGDALVELSTSDAATPRSLAVQLRPAAPTARRVEFVVPGSREGVRHGASGGPVVEVPSGHGTPRMLGLVRARDETTVDALDHAGTGWMIPTERIAERFEAVAALVESPVEREAAWRAHWEPRSRGVATHLDEGFYFQGRVDALAAIARHLDDARGLLLVTGGRGRGKSALLARVVVLSCPRYRTRLVQMSAAGEASRPGYSVDAAVLARDRTLNAVATAAARQVGLDAETAEGLVEALGRPEWTGARFVIDAVDESTDPGNLTRELILPLAQAGGCVVIGALARHVDADLPRNTARVDLDDPTYGDDAITPYVTRRLAVRGGYTDHGAAVVAHAVAERAAGNFLVAELVARTLGLREPIDTADPDWQYFQLPGDVTEAFRDYLARFGHERERVLAVLHPLAHAHGDGLTLSPSDAWLATANALLSDEQEPVTDADLRHAARRSSDYLITSAEHGARRLYHEGLASAIRSAAARERLLGTGRQATPEDVDREKQCTAASRFLDALVELIPRDTDAAAVAFEHVDPYVLRYLPGHLASRGARWRYWRGPACF